MKKIISLVVLVSLCGFIYAGPFGVEMGWSVEDFERLGIPLEQASTNNNITTYYFTPNNPHPIFTTYLVRIDNQKGVYDITAVSDVIEDSSYGMETKKTYNSVREQISSTYGEPEEIDLLMPGSIWDEPGDWMMALYQKERYLMALWNPSSKGIEDIGIDVTGIRSSSSVIKLVYQSPDIAEILERVKKAEASVF